MPTWSRGASQRGRAIDKVAGALWDIRRIRSHGEKSYNKSCNGGPRCKWSWIEVDFMRKKLR